MNTTDQELMNTYGTVLVKATDLIKGGVDPLVVAAALVSLGASIYKTTLSEEDFNLMMDSVSNLRDQVQKLTPNNAAPTTLQ